MQYPKYSTNATPDNKGFSFISTGPNGNIELSVLFTFIDNPELYNLAFGRTKKDGDVDDFAVLNNNDRNVILATVVSIIYRFFQAYPTATVYFTGSTQARTRLYRRAISINFEELSKDFVILGINQQPEFTVEAFVFGKDYEAFLVQYRF